MLILAFDTATDVATSALVDDGEMLGERVSLPRTVLEDVDEMLRAAGRSRRRARGDRRRDRAGQLHEHADRSRGRARARARARRARRGRLDARRARRGRARCGRRTRSPSSTRAAREVFVRGPTASRRRSGRARARAGHRVRRQRRRRAIGTRSRRSGRSCRRTTDELHLPRARFHAALAERFGAAEDVLPDLRPRPRCRGAGVKIELRALGPRDLDALEVIERASYPSPWSRAMFVGRAAEAGCARPRRVRRDGGARRLRDRLALRRRVARDERRGRSVASGVAASRRRCSSASSR